MNSSDDALYRIHQFQAARRGCPPLDYCNFRMRTVNQNDTDLSQVFLPESPVGRKPVFKTAAICATSSAVASIPWYEFMMALALHESGHWGEVTPKQWLANDLAVARGGRICSAHRTSFGVRFWLISDADRRCTTMAMPGDTRFLGGIP